MSKRPTSHPGVFTKGLRGRHYRGLSPNGAILATKAKVARKRLVQRLRREWPQNTKATALAEKLANCRTGHRCHSPACPSCAQAAQAQFAEIVYSEKLRLEAANATKGRRPRFAAVTSVSRLLTSPRGHLGEPTLAQVHRRLTDQLAKAKVRLAICVLEVSLNEHESDRYSSQWQWHLHGVVLTDNPEKLGTRLRKVCPASDTVPRPINAKRWDGNFDWVRYCHKRDHRCRVGIDNAVRHDVKKGGSRHCRGTTYRKLTHAELLELLLFYDSISLDGRLLTKGAQLRATQDGCRIVRIRTPKS